MESASETARDVAHNPSYGDGERNAQFAMRLGALFSKSDTRAQFDTWIENIQTSPLQQIYQSFLL